MATHADEPGVPVCIGRAAQALAEATTVPEVVAVRDVAEAARAYARSAHLGLELQNQAAEIRLRAERKAGGLISSMEHMGRGGDRKSSNAMLLDQLSDLGITKMQSTRWQQLARVSEELFTNYVAAVNRRSMEITATGLLRLNRQVDHKGSSAQCIGREMVRQDKARRTSAPHGNSSPGGNSEWESRSGPPKCGMWCVFSRPAIVPELVEIVGELKDHCQMVEGLMQREPGKEPKGRRRSNRRVVHHYLSEIRALLDRLGQMLAGEH